MLANLGLEGEPFDHVNRVRGRRHLPRSEMLGSQPTYMTAPFAVQQESSRIANSASRPPSDDIIMDNDDGSVVPPSVDMAIKPQQLPLSQQRLSKGGLNIFSWNTDPPKSLPPRVTRERGEEELLRLRPLDSSIQRDLEVLQKFEGSPRSRFLCFSENETSGRQRGGRGNAVNNDPHSSAFSEIQTGSLDNRDNGPTLHRAGRRSMLGLCETEGIAGFSGMGSGQRPSNGRRQRHSGH